METLQTARLETEYIMTMYGALDPPQVIDETLAIFCVTGGWAKGPNINATLIQPAADWIRTMPDGSRRLDVRLTLKTDDGALIYVNYSGVNRQSETSRDRLMRGEILTSNDLYLITAPTFRTSDPKYAWLNTIQTIGKLVQLKGGQDRFIKYDIFAVK